jgi:hypothetical protein
VQLTVTTTYLGRTYTATLTADVPEDLSAFNVKGRITNVLDRELQRCAEITAVALQDQAAAALAEQDARERKARGEAPPPRGPTQILAANTKDPKGRVVVEEHP